MLKNGMFIRLVIGNSCHGVFVTAVMSASWRHKIVPCDGKRRAPFLQAGIPRELGPAMVSKPCVVIFCCKDSDYSA